MSGWLPHEMMSGKKREENVRLTVLVEKWYATIKELGGVSGRVRVICLLLTAP